MQNNPVLFVHGIGASAGDWERIEMPDRNAYYLSFSKPMDNPSDQVPELRSEIERILAIEKKEKIILVCHSMGGLTARQYLQEEGNGRRVEKLVMLSTPNLGSVALSFNLVPYLLLLAGIFGMQWIWPLIFLIAGFIWEWLSFIHGIVLLSPAVFAMRPDSGFIARLNSTVMPSEVKYIAMLSNANRFPYFLANYLLFWEGGDGAVPLSSQRFSPKIVPNFSEIDYSEYWINLPHFIIPQRVNSFLHQALLR